MDLQKYVTGKLDKFRQQVANNVVNQATSVFNATPIGQGINSFNTLKSNPQVQNTVNNALNYRVKPNLPSVRESAQSSWNNNLFNVMSNFNTGVKPIDTTVRTAGLGAKGVLEGLTFGSVNIPTRAPQTGLETGAYAAGNLIGAISPIGIGAKLMTPLGMGTEALAARNLINAPGLVKNLFPVIAGEAAQTGALAGLRGLTNQQFNPLEDIGFGLGARGLLKTAGKLAGPLAKQNATNQYKYLDPKDREGIARTIEDLIYRSEDINYRQKGRPGDEDYLRLMAEKYINKDFAWGMAGKGKTKQYKQSIQNVAQELTNRLRGEYDQPEIGINVPAFVGKNQGKVANAGIGDTAISSEGVKVKGKLKVHNFPTQTEMLNRAEVNAGNPDLYKQRQDKWSGVNPRPLPWETTDRQLGALQRETGQALESQSIKQAKVQPKTTETLLQKSQKALQEVQGQYKSSPQVPLEDIVRSSGIDVKNKVNIIDNYLRTPDRVLKKIGLEQETDQLRKGYDTYLKELPLEIDKITQWSQRADSADSTVSIFKYLDGQKVNLSQNDLKIAGEVKQYLAGWADRLGLPKEGRIANYITHIFDRDLIQKEFDPELAKILRNKVAGSVYDPFLEKRLGALGYKEDAWQALDAYVKRATRKANLDPTLKLISQKSENFEESQFDYVKKYIARVNMQPTKIDNMIDNTIKQAIGYKLGQRPTAVISRALRQAGYRGALGLNVGSALRNLTQISNTYAKLGEKYTALGYVKMLTNGKEELERVGVLRNEFIQDRTMNATKKFWERTDKGLFFLFETAERINRGSAYFGAKSKGLKQGMNEEQAIEYAKKIVRDTQFSFGSIDTPQILSSDIGKTFGQFQSYNLKQAEFLAEMIKNKEFAGLARYTLASFAMVYTIGELIGIDPIDAIPFSGLVTGEGTKIGQTPAISAVTKLKDAAFAQKDKYGNDLEMGDRVDMAIDAVTPIIPAGVQAKKTIQGLDAAIKGYSESKSGRIQYPINKTPVNTLRAGLFGKSNLPEARAYFDNKTTVLGEKQTEQFKQSGDMQGTYNQFMQERTSNRQENTVREQVRSSGGTGQANGKLFYVKDGEVKSVQLDRAIEMPKLTGNYELDKKLMSKYNSTLTAKKNDITALYELGKLSAEEAEKQLKALTSQKLRAGGGRKAKFKKISVSKIKVPRLKAYKAKKIKVSKIGVKFAKVKYPKVKNLKAKKTA